MFLTSAGDSLLPGFVGALSPAAAAQFCVGWYAMKITLGGKISITLAFLCASIWTMLLLIPEDARAAQQFGEVALYILAFPVAWFSGMFSTADGPPSLLYIYLLLTIPNSFLLGYSIAGVFYVLRRVCRFTHTKS